MALMSTMMVWTELNSDGSTAEILAGNAVPIHRPMKTRARAVAQTSSNAASDMFFPVNRVVLMLMVTKNLADDAENSSKLMMMIVRNTIAKVPVRK